MGRKSKVRSVPESALAAQAVVVDLLGIEPVTTTSTTAWKVGCYYGGCDRTFDPKGSGSVIHGGCDAARPVMRAYVAEKDPAKKQAMADKARTLIAK
jgi:hypothetical protein